MDWQSLQLCFELSSCWYLNHYGPAQRDTEIIILHVPSSWTGFYGQNWLEKLLEVVQVLTTYMAVHRTSISLIARLSW